MRGLSGRRARRKGYRARGRKWRVPAVGKKRRSEGGTGGGGDGRLPPRARRERWRWKRRKRKTVRGRETTIGG